MSTVADIGPASPAATASRSHRRATAVAAVLALIAVLAALGAGALYAWDAGFEGRVLPGVRAADLDLSGMTADQALAAVEARYAYGDGRLVLHTPDGDVTVPFGAVARRPDAAAVVAAALAHGRSGSVLERAVAEVRLALDGATVPAPAVRYDEAALRQVIEAAVAPLRQHPSSATISMTRDGIVVGRSHTGRDVDAGAVTAAASAAIADPAAPHTVEIAVTTTVVRPRVEDAAAFDARTEALRIAQPVRLVSGKQGWTIKATVVRSWLRFAPAPGGRFAVVVEPTRIPPALKAVAKGVRKPARSAEYLVARSGRIVGVVASSVGQKLDGQATVSAVVGELQTRRDGTPPARVAAAITPVVPEVGTDEAARKAPVMSLLGSWKTWFPISERNFFGANIWVPASLINGTVLQPGQTFDWWNAIWPVTAARGFGPGGVIKVDHTEPTGALGGGMCSSSTTLFNAAMRAGLAMGARSNHRYYITRYPLGLDATVSITGAGRQTMTFTNDTGHPIFIRGVRIRAGGIGWVRYEIWGIPDGRRVSLSRASVWNVRTATTKTVLVGTLPTGVRKQVEYPSNGMDVSVTRVVRNAAGSVIHRDTWFSHYVLWNGIINVGR